MPNIMSIAQKSVDEKIKSFVDAHLAKETKTSTVDSKSDALLKSSHAQINMILSKKSRKSNNKNLTDEEIENQLITLLRRFSSNQLLNITHSSKFQGDNHFQLRKLILHFFTNHFSEKRAYNFAEQWLKTSDSGNEIYEVFNEISKVFSACKQKDKTVLAKSLMPLKEFAQLKINESAHNNFVNRGVNEISSTYRPDVHNFMGKNYFGCFSRKGLFKCLAKDLSREVYDLLWLKNLNEVYPLLEEERSLASAHLNQYRKDLGLKFKTI